MLVCSAIKFYEKDNPYPRIICGLRHADILEDMFHKHIEYNKETAIQGFLTYTNQFLDRYDAAGYAWRAGQIDEQVTCLYSEDVWPE